MTSVRDCIAPDAVEDWELEAYRDGVAGPHVVAHLVQCVACQRQVAEAHWLEQRLRHSMLRMHCPRPETLRAYYWNELPTLERQDVAQHIAGCVQCRADLDELAAFVAPCTALPWDKVWKNVRQAAEQAQLAMAHLLDPGAQPVLALRGETRQVLFFEAGPVAVSVNVEQEETGGYTLFGQVLQETPAPISNGWVRVTLPGVAPRQVNVDVHGSFSIPGLAPGVYQMIVTLPQHRIVIPMLTLETGS